MLNYEYLQIHYIIPLTICVHQHLDSENFHCQLPFYQFSQPKNWIPNTVQEIILEEKLKKKTTIRGNLKECCHSILSALEVHKAISSNTRAYRHRISVFVESEYLKQKNYYVSNHSNLSWIESKKCRIQKKLTRNFREKSLFICDIDTVQSMLRTAISYHYGEKIYYIKFQKA